MPASATPETVPVVAAVIERDGRFLVARRPAHKRHGDLWEFPGGKVEPGESWAAAAARELAEELGLTLVALGGTLHEQVDPGSPYRIHFIEAAVAGEPAPTEHSDVGWYTLDELAALSLAPTDAACVRALQRAATRQPSSTTERSHFRRPRGT